MKAEATKQNAKMMKQPMQQPAGHSLYKSKTRRTGIRDHICCVYFPIFYTALCLFILRYLSNNEDTGGSILYEHNADMKQVISKDINFSTPFPQSIRNDNQHEEIAHPGNAKITMNVPQFWNPPIDLPRAGDRLMTKEEALSIGSKIHIFEKGKEIELETIFVAIASYRDWQCPVTLESIFSRAKYPQRVRVAVVDQMDVQLDSSCGITREACESESKSKKSILCDHRDRIDVYEMEDELAVGPCFARHIGHRMYRGEYYAMQVDAHVTFVQDWDVDVISQIKVTGNEMAVLTTYLSDITGSIDPITGYSLRNTRPIMCNTDYESNQQGTFLRHKAQPEGVSSVRGSPQMEPYWAAGFSFSRGHFVVNVPYDQYLPMIFLGEEMSIGLRGFTYGYDMYANEKSICFHSYAIGPNQAKRNEVKHFWEHSDMYRGVGMKAMKRVLGVVQMNPEVPESEWDHAELDKYGIGAVRTPEKFFRTFGIHVRSKKTEHNLCRFVENRMHQMFSSHLRDDGMGVDYDQVTFELKDETK